MSQEISRRVGIKYKPIPKIGIEYVDEGSGLQINNKFRFYKIQRGRI